MPRRKKVETPAAQAEVKEVQETKAVEAAVEAAPAKKTTRKTTAKKTAAKPEVKAEPVVEAAAPAAAPTAEVIIEFGGAQVSVDEIIKNAKAVVGEDKNIKVYVQPENSKAYIVVGDDTTEMDVYFVQ